MEQKSRGSEEKSTTNLTNRILLPTSLDTSKHTRMMAYVSSSTRTFNAFVRSGLTTKLIGPGHGPMSIEIRELDRGECRDDVRTGDRVRATPLRHSGSLRRSRPACR